jgi:transposase
MIDRETPMLFPPDMKEWLPENSLVYFIVDAVEQLNVSTFKVNERGTGSEQYPPEMMLALLIYSYATGRFSSREIEGATHTDIAVRYICGGTEHPDHDTICDFRARNREGFKEAFVKILMMAQEMKYLKKVGGVSIDGTKVKAAASKHRAVSYSRAGELIAAYEEEIEELTKRAEAADDGGLETGLTIPEEIGRRKERKAALAAARETIEAQYEEEKAEKKARCEEIRERREAEKAAGKKPGGSAPKKPAEEVPGNKQYNFTDSDSRIMKSGSGEHFEQAYNAQAVSQTKFAQTRKGVCW